MGEFTDGQSPENIAAQDRATNMTPDDGEETSGVKTDVQDVHADGERNGLPVFKVTKNEFYQNMKMGRQRLRFSNGSRVQKYMQGTKYRNPFWIEHEGYLRKVK